MRKLKTKLCVRGTEFQMNVWNALCEIPAGSTNHLCANSTKSGETKSCQSSWHGYWSKSCSVVYSCHRVLRSDGALGGFRWGLELKVKMLEERKRLKI